MISPFALLSLNMQTATLICETQTVMALRLMGMSGTIPARRGENKRMVAEKTPAMIDAYAAATKATLAGKRPDQIMSDAMKPLSRKVRANRKRLMK